ncbi:hypothetical protein [Flammeovirga kamogawensis]|uniref:Uncharacterized protein n=1 Tax=Flammeovirga kamogawensis TaxID=373891 RepID=A0ABX8H5J1_9BACT|nr:hypothetical protein [Flammeovirga kamogawensis]MBB6461770.1 hypothetical protein [Flammeovirga kamogawensis]QWG10686.1 hypothetical protein KM029_25215 [Flammeovirga kamogawensis]TRX63789.1 hypothetical protein EO216_25590 [Flammeovirga kamogawensis]
MKKVTFVTIIVVSLLGIFFGYHKFIKHIPQDGEHTKFSRADNILDSRYLEVLVVGGDAITKKLIANCYNTTLLNGETNENRDSAPQKLVDQLNTDEITAQFGAFSSFINGPRVWCLDWTEVQVGKVRDFNGLKAKWVAALELDNPNKFSKSKPPYQVSSIERKTSFGINKGTDVFLLEDPRGTVWLMKSYSLKLDPTMSRDKLPALMASLNLPDGWSYRIVTLKKDIVLKPLSGVAQIIADDKDNVYDRTGIGYSNYNL